MFFDLVYIADIRFPGGTSTALYYELKAAVSAGLKVGLIPVASPVLTTSRPPNLRLLAQIRNTRTEILQIDANPRCRVCLLYHPTLLDSGLKRLPRFKADTFALVAHHPPLDRFGRESYAAARFGSLARDLFGHDLTILPVGPMVRQGFEAVGLSKHLHDRNWDNLIDVSEFEGRKRNGSSQPVVIGRHSRPGREKWPEPVEALQAYPDNPDYEFRMLGADLDYLTEFEKVPSNWHLLPFTKRSVADFLKGLDVYSYFHSPAWIEAFGYCALEALATGLPTVLPHYFEKWFEDAALYSSPAEAPLHYERVSKDREFRRDLSERARNFAADRFGLTQFADRFERLAGKVRTLHQPGSVSLETSTKPAVVMAVTSNGIGLGHITRQLAVAKALGPKVKVVFFSLSEAVSVAQKMGYMAEFRPFHRRLGCDVDDWNDFFYREMRDALAFYRPELVIFDGNTPYSGLLDALKHHEKARAAWVRRGMWRTPFEEISNRASSFDIVVEPGELAGSEDPGHSRNGSEHFVTTDPVLLVTPEEMLSRVTARRLLKLPEDGTLGLVLLGSERNYDMSQARQAVETVLHQKKNVHFVEIRSPISPAFEEDPHPRHHRRVAYPLGQYLNAFDFAISAAGYNSYHELIAASVPTVFVPNSAPEMDLQEARSSFADKAGLALSCDAADPFGLEYCLEKILDADIRNELKANCARLPAFWHGAHQVSELLTVTGCLPTGALQFHDGKH
ncbi:MAG: hypothetical protein K5905_02555 [Roseibium sp.]|uniref:hypothetical protein n=1 Tax=Roseibium sp. TaxID=1936156 RepID=UPI002633610D|nr:hypothetical protein [Roseibium sp.]MCV0424330.1 hypothetical protein [Roseibium sp.]